MKRLVMVHADGLHQIFGRIDGETLPPTAIRADDDAVIGIRGVLVPVIDLYRVTPRAAFYRAPIAPASAPSFHESQR